MEIDALQSSHKGAERQASGEEKKEKEEEEEDAERVAIFQSGDYSNKSSLDLARVSHKTLFLLCEGRENLQDVPIKKITVVDFDFPLRYNILVLPTPYLRKHKVYYSV